MSLQSFKELLVWQKGIDLVEEVYRLSASLPKDERFGLKSQMQRAAVSIPSNIAEGYGRTHRGDYLRYLSIARGSLLELETQIEVTVRLGFLSPQQVQKASILVEETGRLLFRLIQSLSPQKP
mgnify:CR=1 FL=1